MELDEKIVLYEETLKAIAPFALEDYVAAGGNIKFLTVGYHTACEKLVKAMEVVHGRK